MATTKVLDVGNCNPDHSTIRRMLEQNFDVEIDRVMFVDEALEKMRETDYALVLVNRLIFDDASPGLRLIESAQLDDKLSQVPIMMISNFKEAQETAIEAGAVAGFGKNSIFDKSTRQRVANYLPSKN